MDEFDFVVEAPFGCPAFDIGIVGVNKVIVQVFQAHLAIHNEFKSTVTNLDTGFSGPDNGAWMDVLHFGESGLESVTTIGSIFRITLRGQGIVVQDTGIITFDPDTGEVLFEGGPHESFHDTDLLCSLLDEG